MNGKLGSLEIELLSTILDYVDLDSPHTTKSAMLVNSHLYKTAQLVVHRRKSIHFGAFAPKPADENDELSEASQQFRKKAREASRACQLIAKWLADPYALRGIRYLSISGHGYRNHRATPPSQDQVTSEWASLVLLLKSLSNLKTLTWNYHGQIPLTVLDALHQHHPKAHLEILWFQRRSADVDQNDPVETALASSAALIALKAVVWRNGAEEQPDLREAAFQRIVAQAPNLRFASITAGRSGCKIRRLTQEQRAELREKEAAFYTHTRPNASLKALTLDGYGISKSSLDQWGSFIDLSNLESLKCSRGTVPDKSYFDIAPTLLPSLKHVSLNFSYGNNPDIAGAADNYLSKSQMLETLSLWSWWNVIPLTTVLRHGPSLKSLQLHERESIDLNVPRGLLKSEDVKAIRKACPKLQELTLDVDREMENWENEVENPQIWRELALFGKQLEKVQIYFDLGIAREIEKVRNRNRAGPEDESPATKAVPTPDLASFVEYVKSIWKTVYANKNFGPRALDVKLGEWERKMATGYPAPWILWEQRNRRFLMARPDERDDRLGEGVVTHVGIRYGHD